MFIFSFFTWCEPTGLYDWVTMQLRSKKGFSASNARALRNQHVPSSPWITSFGLGSEKRHTGKKLSSLVTSTSCGRNQRFTCLNPFEWIKLLRLTRLPFMNNDCLTGGNSSSTNVSSEDERRFRPVCCNDGGIMIVVADVWLARSFSFKCFSSDWVSNKMFLSASRARYFFSLSKFDLLQLRHTASSGKFEQRQCSHIHRELPISLSRRRLRRRLLVVVVLMCDLILLQSTSLWLVWDCVYVVVIVDNCRDNNNCNNNFSLTVDNDR